MRMFTLDDEVVQSKARTASNKIGSVVWNLAEAEKTVLKAVEEVNKHSELSGIAYGSMLDKLEKTNDILEEYNQIESLVYDYCEEIDDNFFKEQEKILEGLSRLKVEDIRVPNNIGIVETRTIIEHGGTYTYEVKKKDIGFEDLLTYGTVSEIMQNQYNEMKNRVSKDGEEYGGSINDYIKALIEDGQFDYEVAWKKNASLVIDLIPVVGDAKGIIECVVGNDLITGRELSGLERGLCALSIIPLIGDGGSLIKAGVKGGIGSVLKVLGKEGAENVAFYMGSAVMEEAGANPLWGLVFYQFGRTGWKNKDKIIDALNKINLKNTSKLGSVINNKVYNKYIKEINSHPNKEVVNEVIEYVIKKQNSIDTDILLDSNLMENILESVDSKITRKELQNLKWSILEKATEANKINLTPSQRARLWQGGDPYFGLDIYEDMILKKGEVVYTGYPFPTGYSFTKETLDSIDLDSKKLFQGVQVNPRVLADGTGDYKFQVIGFQMMDDVPSAKGMTNANPQLGIGGLEQIFTPDFKELVRQGKVEPLLDKDTIEKLKKIGVEFNPVLLQQVDKDGKYIYKSICEVAEVIVDDSNIIKLNNYELTKSEIDEINDAIREIRLNGGGIN